MSADKPITGTGLAGRIVLALGERNIVLVGMMGAGKTSIGKRLAAALDIPFADADQEIEIAANMTIPEIFDTYGEEHFRDGERKVIARLLGDGPKVIATGGGAVGNAETRSRIKSGAISIWLNAEVPVLLERVKRRANRPLLRNPDPEGVLRHLLAERGPLYAHADLTITSHDTPHTVVLDNILAQLDNCLAAESRLPQTTSAEQQR